MTRVRIEDLPPKLRKQVEAKAAASGSATRDEGTETGSRAGQRTSRDAGPAYRCCRCGETFPRYGAAIERHADAHGGARLEAILR